MEEITFEDMLTHYQLKLKEASDGIETLKNYLRRAQMCLDDGWKGTAADACRCKLETVNGELAKAQAELSDALTKLSAIEATLTTI